MKTGIELITEERQRQLEKEGWTSKHDDQHTSQQLPILAMLYACPAKYRPMLNPTGWFTAMQWNLDWWKPTERIKELQKAGALIAAEIDRLQRIKSIENETAN